MHINGAYGQQNLWGVQESQRAQAGGGAQHTFASGGDTVSISPEARKLAKAARGVAQGQAETEVEEYPAAQSADTPQYSSPALDYINSPKFDLSQMTIATKPNLFVKLLPWLNAEEPGGLPRSFVRFESQDPTEMEYIAAVHKIYNDVRKEMGMYGLDADGNLPATTPEQEAAFEKEVLRRMRADERVNSLMEQFGINEQLDGTKPFFAPIRQDIDKHFHFMKCMLDACERGVFSAEELGKIMAQYARGEITADDADAVLARYANTESEEGNFRDLLSVSIDEYQKSWQDDEDVIRLLKEDKHINHLMQQIGV